MSRKPLPPKDKSHNGLSADEFEKQLLNWFQDRGLLADLQAHLRHQMIVALKDTSLNIHSAGTFHQAGSPKLQAINLLVAEFLLRQQCHYTLSVFTSEVPLLRNLPEFSTAASNSSSRPEPGSHEDRFPGFHERDVFDILEALGFSSNSEESQIINDLYENSQGESLLTCVIRSLPNTNRTYGKITSRSESPEPKSTNEQLTALQQCSLFTDDMRTVIQQSNLRAEQIVLLHDTVKRIVEDEIKTVQKSEEAKYHQELINREQRIQAVWNQHDEEMQKNQQKTEERLSVERMKLAKELHEKQAQFAALAAQLREQQQEVASRLNYIQERSDLLERKEVELKVFRKESEEHLQRKHKELDAKEISVQEEHARLEAETNAREQERKELQANRIQIETAAKAIKESQVEIALLRDVQRQFNSQIKSAQENFSTAGEVELPRKKSTTSIKKKKTELFSQGVQADLVKQRGAVPKKHNVHQQTHQVSQENQSLQTQISGTDMDDVFLQLRQQNVESERRRSQHEMIENLVDQLQQENLELRGHVEQQRLRIQEVTSQSAELMHRLSNAHNTISRLRTQPTHPEHDHHGVQTSPRSSSDTQAAPPPPPPLSPPPAAIPVRDSVPGLALGAYGYHTPTPAPLQPRHVPEPRPPTRGFVRSSQVGAGEESYFSRRLPPDTFVSSYSPANRERRKPPRRFMVHSVSSSDDSCPSPTEDMLREARRRLRRLEDETVAIDRSYQEFRLRNADNLTNTASILFQPLSLSGDYGANYSIHAPQNLPARTLTPTPPVFPFPPVYSRNRLYAARVGLLNQFQSTTVLQPSVLNPFPLFALSRANEQARQTYTFTSSQVQNNPAVNPIYSVPSEVFSNRPHSTMGGSATTMAHAPPLSSFRVQNDIQSTSVTRGSISDLRLPAGFSLREQSRYNGERESFQRIECHKQARNSRWLQEPPPHTSSVPHIPVAAFVNEKDTKSQNESEKSLVFLHQDNANKRTQDSISEHQILEPLSASVVQEALTSLELTKEASLHSTTDSPVRERLALSSQKIILSEEEKNKSHSHSIKSHCESNKFDNANSDIPKEIHILSESSSESPYVPPEIQEDLSRDRVQSSQQHEHSQQLRVPHTALPMGDEITVSNESSCSQKKFISKETDSNDVSQAVFSKLISESPKDDCAHQETSDASRNSDSGKVLEVLDAEKEPTGSVLHSTVELKERSQENTAVEETKTSLENISEKECISNDEKSTLSGLPTKHVSQNSPQDPSLTIIEGQHPGVSQAIIDNHFEQHSNSPSVPSTLGSSKELSSDIISAGEEKSDDTW